MCVCVREGERVRGRDEEDYYRELDFRGLWWNRHRRKKLERDRDSSVREPPDFYLVFKDRGLTASALDTQTL